MAAQTPPSTARAWKGGSRMTAIPTCRDADGNMAQFLPVGGMPGFTHRVVVNRRKAGWLAEGHLATAKAAAFFIRQVAEKQGKAGMAARRIEAASAMRPSAENSRHRALLSQSIARVVARIRQKQDTRRSGAEEILAEAVGDLERRSPCRHPPRLPPPRGIWPMRTTSTRRSPRASGVRTSAPCWPRCPSSVPAAIQNFMFLV